jgi:hypothetical protein
MREDQFHKIDAPEFSKDLLLGAEAIATWLFVAPERRRLYHLIETSRMPTFRLGSKIAAQKSILRAAFWAQQKRAFGNDDIEALARLRLQLLKAVELLRANEGNITAGHGLEHADLCLAMFEVSNEIERFLAKS